MKRIKKDQPDQIVFIGILFGKTRCVPERAFWQPDCIIVGLDRSFCVVTIFHFVVILDQKCNLYEKHVGSAELYLLNTLPKVISEFEGGSKCIKMLYGLNRQGHLIKCVGTRNLWTDRWAQGISLSADAPKDHPRGQGCVKSWVQ